ncbi:molybdate ABC transporter substrate-binding protein [Castellaniella sp. WN]
MKARLLGLCLCLILSAAQATAAFADTLLIAAAGGYRKPLMELIRQLPTSSGLKVEASFGHIRGIVTQARQNADVALLIGDRALLEPEGLAARYERLGAGRLAIIYRQGLTLDSIRDLAGDPVQRYAIPHHQRTIYGRAAAQCLQRTGLDVATQAKRTESDGVPQVGAYVALGDMDAGFVNLTEALGRGDSIGGHFLVPDTCYDPIEITMAVTKAHEHDTAVRIWTDYVATPAARAILRRHGLD